MGEDTKTERVSKPWSTRCWVASDTGREGLWPWGALPLLGLVVVAAIAIFHVAPNDVEAQTWRQARRQLNAAGLDWVEVTASGQELVVRGNTYGAATPELHNHLVDVVQSENCVLFGCSVLVELVEADVANVRNKQAHRYHNFSFQAHQGRAVLSGEVASESARQAVIAEAGKYFSEVTDNLLVDDTPAMAADAEACRRALSVLALLDGGRASWLAGRLEVTGLVSDARRSAALAQFSADSEGVTLGEIELLVKEDVDRCDQALAQALAAETVRFDRARATIKPASGPLLHKLAATMISCPGDFAVEGHTDSDGEAEANLALSVARATAVVEALIALEVDPKRLNPQGFGENRPVSNNNTALGRSKNRRIEIHVMR